jgi:hypothetical protein
MSREALDLYEWDDRSLWGYDPAGGHYFAHLWRNGKPEEPSGTPDIWISAKEIITPQALAKVISDRTGRSIGAVQRAMCITAAGPALEAVMAKFAAEQHAAENGRVRILCLGLADGRTDGIDAVGCYLAYYDPEADDGHGAARWTLDPDEAMTFVSATAAMDCYRAVPTTRPVRADGQPNRPLTMFAVGVR